MLFFYALKPEPCNHSKLVIGAAFYARIYEQVDTVNGLLDAIYDIKKAQLQEK
jgi:GH18 family chitinase